MPLLAIEGPDEVGKTTLAHALTTHLAGQGYAAVYIAFPGHEPKTIGAEVYRLHHESQRGELGEVPPLALQLLHLAAHAQSVEVQIRRLLRLGHFLILDRFWWSLVVYGRHFGLPGPVLNHMIAIERLIWSEVEPSCVVLVERVQPLTSAIEPDEFAAISRIYRQVAHEEAVLARVETLDNNNTFDVTFASLAAIAGSAFGSRSTI